MDIKVLVQCLLVASGIMAYIIWTVYEISKPDKDDRLSFVYWLIFTWVAVYMTVVWAWS